MRVDRETLKAKMEWEGDEAIEWFEPEEVPVELEDLWRRVRAAWDDYQKLTELLNYTLWDED